MIEYTIKELRMEQTATRTVFLFCLTSPQSSFAAWLAVSESEWASYKVGDKVNIAVSAAVAEPVTEG